MLGPDLPTSTRVADVGIDNRAVGATAAYLLSQWLGENNLTAARQNDLSARIKFSCAERTYEGHSRGAGVGTCLPAV